jgi:hypothetical protein
MLLIEGLKYEKEGHSPDPATGTSEEEKVFFDLIKKILA